MFRIRKHIFETNSSSSDYYYDDYDDCGNDTASADQLIHVVLKYPDEFDEDAVSEMTQKIIDAIEDDWEIFAPVFELRDEPDDETIEENGDEILLYLRAYCKIRWYGGYAGDRYSPPEPPEPEVYDEDEMPGKDVDFKGKEEAKEKLLKNLKEAGFTDVIKVLDIYGDPVDECDYYDNLD